MAKNGFTGVCLGLSGGIDSALVAAMAADAVGGGNVYGISMPSMYSSQGSKDDAADLAPTSRGALRRPTDQTDVRLLPADLGIGWSVRGEPAGAHPGVIVMAYSNPRAVGGGDREQVRVGLRLFHDLRRCSRLRSDQRTCSRPRCGSSRAGATKARRGGMGVGGLHVVGNEGETPMRPCPAA